MKRAACFLALALAGCEPEPNTVEIFAITYAPPASKGTIVSDTLDERFAIDLSVGVALAVQCYDTCGDYGCNFAKLTSGDVDVLGIRPLYRVGGDQNDFVLLGSGVGTTVLHVETECAAQDYEVVISPRTP